MSDLEIKRGDDEQLNIVAAVDGEAVDIAGAELWFTIKRAKSDPDSAAYVMKESPIDIVIDPDQETNPGQAVIHLAPDDTRYLVGEYYFGVQIRRGGVTTEITSGTINISPDLVRA